MISTDVLLLNALIHLRDNDPKDKRDGICPNVYRLLQDVGGIAYFVDVYDQLTPLMRLWPKYSGDSAYPVGGEAAYIYADDLWDTEQPGWMGKHAARRRELLDWLIEELTKRISNEPTDLASATEL